MSQADKSSYTICFYCREKVEDLLNCGWHLELTENSFGPDTKMGMSLPWWPVHMECYYAYKAKQKGVVA